jgi:ribosomal-protein-alanine N-acetyltransferase
MHAVLKLGARQSPMSVGQLDAVVAIEQQVYDFPWSRGNFIDSLSAGYLARVRLMPMQGVIGYFLAMPGVQEMHLLNLAVAAGHQGHGHGRAMMDELIVLSRQQRAERLWLEVRQSNPRARQLYERIGFVQVGLRKRYYPAPHGQREDAVVMSLPLHDSPAASAQPAGRPNRAGRADPGHNDSASHGEGGPYAVD